MKLISLDKMVAKSRYFIKKNAPTILLALGATGMIATNVLTAIETKKIDKELDENMEKSEKIICHAKHYILPVITGGISLGLLFAGNQKYAKIESGLIAAYAALSDRYLQYQKKAGELLGDRVTELEEALLEEQKSSFPVDVSEGNIIVYDENTQRYYETTILELTDAQYQLNRLFILREQASLNDWCELTGQEYLSYGNDVGWSIPAGYRHEYCWIEFELEYHTLDGDYYYILHYPEPTADYLNC